MQAMPDPGETREVALALRGPRSRAESEGRATLALAFGLAVLVHGGMLAAAYAAPEKPVPEKREENRERVIETLRVAGVVRAEPEHVPRPEPVPYARPSVAADEVREEEPPPAGGEPEPLEVRHVAAAVPPEPEPPADPVAEPESPPVVLVEEVPRALPEPPDVVEELEAVAIIDDAPEPPKPVFIPVPDPSLPAPVKPKKGQKTGKGKRKPSDRAPDAQIVRLLTSSSSTAEVAVLSSITSLEGGSAGLGSLIGDRNLESAFADKALIGGGAVGGLGLSRQGTGGLGFGTRGGEAVVGSGGDKLGSVGLSPDQLMSFYVRKISAALRRKIEYPKQAARRGIEGTVTLELVIEADGKVVARRLHRSSGHEVLDQAALQMAEKVESLPPPPRSLDWTSRAVRVPIRYELGR